MVSRLNVTLVQPGVEAEVVYSAGNPKKMDVKTIDLSGSSVPGIERRLEDLNQLRDKGLITSEEYQQRRAEIIKEI